jgi:acetyl esterase
MLAAMGPQLDPESQALLDVMRAAGTPQPYMLSIEDARESMRAALVTKGDPITLRAVQDISLPTAHGALGLRLYRPADGPLPIVLFLHGGGWTLNDLDTHDRLCRRIARRSGWLLASLDYRKAPEHKHPAALEDAQSAYRWLLDNAAVIGGDPSGVAVAGESAGATTVACLTLLLRDQGAPIPVYQILAYPMTDGHGGWPSYEERGTGYSLDLKFAQWAMDNYLPAGHDLEDPYLFPLAASDLSDLAPTLIMTAEFDPLRDEGVAYAQKLKAAGVTVEHVHVDDQMHGFLLIDRAVAKAGALIDRLADALSRRAPGRLPGAGSSQAPAVTAVGSSPTST